MNYRHAFHAGNFADVVKHLALLLCLDRLKAKDKAFFVLDAHAGRGDYDLTSEAAQRSPEWRDGIARIAGHDLPGPALEAGLGAYLEAVDARMGLPARYPGSPRLIANAARAGDRLVFNELHPLEREALKTAFAGDARVQVSDLDAYVAVKAHLPPEARRGLVVIDPPFEATDEFDRLANGLEQARRRWASGSYLIWRPLKDLRAADRFDAGLRRDWPGEAFLRADLWVRDLATPGKLAGAGVILLNPPFGVAQRLAACLPVLAERLAQGPGAGWRVDQGQDPSCAPRRRRTGARAR